MSLPLKPNVPELIWDSKSGGFGGDARTTLIVPGTDSATVTLGGILPLLDGTGVAPTGFEGGVGAFADDDLIGGYIVDVRSANGMSVFDPNNTGKEGTVTDATSVIPAKYTFAASNDQVNTTPKLEYIVFTPIFTGDILEMSLFNDAGTATVDRGTTTAKGTTGSSAHIGVGMSVNVTAQVGLTESTAAVDFANLDFFTVPSPSEGLGQNLSLTPERSDRVYVSVIRSAWNAIAAA